MPINAELQKWLVEKTLPALSPEEQQVFNTILGKEAVAEQLNRAWMAPPDYNRKMDELKTKETQLNQELQTHIASLNQWRDGKQTEVDGKVSQLQAKYDADVAALRTQIEAEGLQPSVSQPAKPNSAAVSTNGNSEYLTRKEASAILNRELTQAAFVQAITSNMVERHRQLFGSTPDVRQLTDTAFRTGKGIEEVWYETYKIADKEKELQEAAVNKRIEDGINERLTKLQADGAMNQQNFSGRPEESSPIRQMIAAQKQADANSPLATPAPVLQQSEGVNAAVEALRSGRFAVKYPGQP